MPLMSFRRLGAVRPFLLVILLAPALWLKQPVIPAKAAPEPGKLRLPHSKTASAERLIAEAELIVSGHLEDRVQSHPTGERLGSGELVNFTQYFQVKHTLKGRSLEARIALLIDGVKPLPEASDPLNLTYIGPLESGSYVLFLRKLPNSDYYYIPHSWQSIYPVMEGRTIALRQGGFDQLDHLTLSELQEAVRRGARRFPLPYRRS